MPSTTSPPPSLARPTIILFGDSLTQMGYGDISTRPSPSIGWVSLLSSAYQRRVDVLNRGYSGYNTRHAIDIVPRIFGDNNSNTRPLFCTVFFGANDQALPGERQHVPKDEYINNLIKIVTTIRQCYKKTTNNNSDDNDDKDQDNNTNNAAHDDVPIIIIGPPPIDQVTWKRELGLYNHFDRLNDVAHEYSLAAKHVAQQLHCPFVDTWELLSGHDINTYADHLSDGLHLSSSGNILLFEGLMNVIKTDLGQHLLPSKTDDSKQGIQVDGTLWTDLC